MEDAHLVGAEAEQENVTNLEPGTTAATYMPSYEYSDLPEHLEGYNPYSFGKEMEKLEEMSKQLEMVKQTLDEASMKSLLLNADVVTMFDPISSEQLKSITMSCTKCAEKIMNMQTESIDINDKMTIINDNEALIQGTEAATDESMDTDQQISTCSTEPPLHED